MLSWRQSWLPLIVLITISVFRTDDACAADVSPASGPVSIAMLQDTEQGGIVVEELPVTPVAEPVPSDEEILAGHAAEMAKLADDALLAALTEDAELQTRIDSQIEAVEEAAGTALTAQEFGALLAEQLDRVESPQTLAFLTRAHANKRADQIKSEVARLLPGELPSPWVPESPTDLGKPVEADAVPALLDRVRHERKQLLADRSRTKRILDHMKRLSSAWEDYRDTGDWRDTALQEQETALQSLKKLQLERLAGILELEERIKADTVERGELAAEAQADQEAVIRALQARLDKVAEVRAADRLRQARVEMVLLWKAWAEIQAGHADTRLPLADAAIHSLQEAERPAAELDEFHRTMQEFRAREANANATTMTDSYLGKMMEEEDRSRYETGRNLYYLEQEDTVRQLEHLQDALTEWKKLIQDSTEYRTGMEGSVQDLEPALEVRASEYAAARAMVAIAAHPEARDKCLTTFEALGYSAGSLPLAGDVPPQVDDWVEQMVLAEARWLGQQQWISDMQMTLSEVGLDAEISTQSDLLTEIEHHRDEKEGHRSAVAASIQSLTADYRKHLRENAWRNLLKLALIPIVAWLITFCCGRFANRLKREREGADEATARRMATLANTATSAINSLVWFLAVVYMLKLAGLDITPLVASASVLGLAVAFASQTLIKDFFYGIVILWEGQFTEHEWVIINGQFGQIERMGMRSTQLRDLEGNLQYIPNSAVGNVKNCMRNWAAVHSSISLKSDRDMEAACRVIKETVDAMKSETEWADLLVGDAENLRIGSKDNSRTIQLHQVTAPGRQWDVEYELKRRLSMGFEKENIEVD